MHLNKNTVLKRQETHNLCQSAFPEDDIGLLLRWITDATSSDPFHHFERLKYLIESQDHSQRAPRVHIDQL